MEIDNLEDLTSWANMFMDWSYYKCHNNDKWNIYSDVNDNSIIITNIRKMANSYSMSLFDIKQLFQILLKVFEYQICYTVINDIAISNMFIQQLIRKRLIVIRKNYINLTLFGEELLTYMFEHEHIIINWG